MSNGFWIIKGKGGYYTPCVYKGELLNVDLNDYAERNKYYSECSVFDLFDQIPLMVKKEEDFKLVNFKFVLTEVIND